MTTKSDEHYDRALDLFAAGEHEAAVAEYRAAIDRDPAHTEAMHGLARAYQELERLDEAIQVALRIVEIDPDDALAHTSLSILYWKKGMIAEAEAESSRARILGWKHELRRNRRGAG